MSQAQATLLVETARVRVTEWRFGPGDATGPHTHEFDYVVIPVTGGDFEVRGADGTSGGMQQDPGAAYARAAGVSHDIVNRGPKVAIFVEVELLEPARDA